jgi:hypothetical protein
MPYPKTTTYIGAVPRGATLPHWFAVQGVGQCIVKFFENPQGSRALVNEIIGFGLADILGLEHPPVGVVEITTESLGPSDTLEFVNHDIYKGERFVFKAGLGFYAKWLDPKDEVFAVDLKSISGAVNPQMLAGVVVLDLLINNRDRKPKNTNLILHRESGRQHLKLIDLGMAFGSANWELGNLKDPSLPPLNEPLPYASPPIGLLDAVKSGTDFEPFLAKLDDIDRAAMIKVLGQVPTSWGLSELHQTCLVDYILERASTLPKYLEARISSRTKRWWQ